MSTINQCPQAHLHDREKLFIIKHVKNDFYRCGCGCQYKWYNTSGIGTLKVKISADTTAFENALKHAESKFGSAADQIARFDANLVSVADIARERGEDWEGLMKKARTEAIAAEDIKPGEMVFIDKDMKKHPQDMPTIDKLWAGQIFAFDRMGASDVETYQKNKDKLISEVGKALGIPKELIKEPKKFTKTQDLALAETRPAKQRSKIKTFEEIDPKKFFNDKKIGR